MAEGAPLLREYTLIAYRGFESLLLRHTPFTAARACRELRVETKAGPAPEEANPRRMMNHQSLPRSDKCSS